MKGESKSRETGHEPEFAGGGKKRRDFGGV